MLLLQLLLILQLSPASAQNRAALTNNQVTLLRTEATILQRQTSELRSHIATLEAQQDIASLKTALRGSMSEAVGRLATTRERFLELIPNEHREQHAIAAKVFFDDIATYYKDSTSRLEDMHLSRNDRPGPPSKMSADQRSVYTAISGNALWALEHNAEAYEVVASRGSDTFDLVVDSVPPGAEILYKRKGDAYRANSDPTNTTLDSLGYAIWFVRVRLKDYEDQEKVHDPFRERNHVMMFVLQKK